MHDLLMQRAHVVEQIAKGKPPGKPVWRPAREAAIMRRLLARHSGTLPPEAVARLWREMIGIFAAQQARIVIAASAKDHAAARSYFGEFAILQDADPLQSVANGSADIGVRPWPGRGDGWWHDLPEGLFVSAVLSFAGRQTHVALSKVAPEPTGDDLTWLAVRGSGDFEGRAIVAHQGWTLLELQDFRQPQDPASQNANVRYVGSFAAPYIFRTA